MALLSRAFVGKPGFLLMEIIVAIALFAGLSIVIGSYWGQLALQRVHATMQLQALQAIREYIEHTQVAQSSTSKMFTLTSSKKSMNNQIHISAGYTVPAASLLSVTAQWKDNAGVLHEIGIDTYVIGVTT